MLFRKIPVHLAIFYCMVCSLVTYLIITSFTSPNKTNQFTVSAASSNSSSDNNINRCGSFVKRIEGYSYIKPYVYAERKCESDRFISVKQDLNNFIELQKSKGIISSASIYFRIFDHAEWIGINTDEKFRPGSLMKVPELMTFYKMNADHPGFLDKEITYNQELISPKTAHYISKSIELGKKYTVRQLLYYMIAYSDNNATMILNKMIDVNEFKKTFTDLGLTAPDWNSNDYHITAKEYSVFMVALYNAGYLNMHDSEEAVELLSKCDFMEGMLKGLPSNTKIAHKFGESGDDDYRELHESALVYVNSMPYLITIMTKGKDSKQLPEVIKSLTEILNRKILEIGI